MAVELDSIIEEAFGRYKEFAKEEASLNSLLAQINRIHPLIRLFTQWRHRNLPGQLKKAQVNVYRSKDSLNFQIGKRSGIYHVESVDLFNTRPLHFTRVNFVHRILGEDYTASYMSSFIKAVLREEKSKPPTDLLPPVFLIRDNNHPLLYLPSDFQVRFFGDNLDSTDFTLRPIRLSAKERTFDASCLAN